MQYKNTTSSQAPRCASWKAYKLTNKQADKLTGRKYEEIKRRQDDKMTPKFSKNCQRLPKHGEKLLKAVKAWQKLQKNCKKLPKDTKSSQTMSKLAKIKKNSKEKTNDGKICQKLLEGGKKW